MLCAVSCQSSGEYFNRKNIIPTVNSTGYGYRNGSEIDTTNFICVNQEEYKYLMEYYEDKENRLYECLKFGRCK